ncbi:protein STRUBBELIG-RECEPTOR FAMILY 6-like [Wolffia australiana]
MPRSLFLLLACIWAWIPAPGLGATDPTDLAALSVMFTSLNSPGQLTGWTATGGDPCGQSWRGITCSGSRVTEIKLSGLGLTGSIGYQLQSLTFVSVFDLSNNNIGASGPIPYGLPPNLTRLHLGGNVFAGGVPYSVSQMARLEYLNISHNQLREGVNDMFGSLPALSTIDLSFNSIPNGLPQSFSFLTALTNLYLQNNQFTGPIDVLANLPLQNLDVSNNRFTGWIPDRLRRINSLRTDGNSWNTGPAPPPPPFATPPGRRASPTGSGSPTGGSAAEDGGKSGIGGGGIAGIIIALIVVGAVVGFFVVKRRRSRRSSPKESHDPEMPFVAMPEPHETKAVHPSSAVEPASAAASLKLAPTERLKPFDEDEDLSGRPAAAKKSASPNIDAKVFPVADLQMATGSFSVDNLLGQGSLGRVYRGQFDDGKVLAVKKINASALPNQSAEEFLRVVSNVARLRHPNVTLLVGYCSEFGQHLLVYEFHRNGSLHDYLHLSDEYSRPLTWNTRVKIALGTARALEYLHESCSPAVVHKNFKSANILLDSELGPHISDCGLSSLIPDALYQDTGSGYTAPEVAMSGQYTMKSDVYSFGVVMLELLTGRKPFDSARGRAEQLLVRWAYPQLHDIDALDKMVDPGLKGLYPAKSLSRFADVIALCVQAEPEFRPPMSEVVQALVRLVQRANMSKKIGSADEADAQDYFL